MRRTFKILAVLLATLTIAWSCQKDDFLKEADPLADQNVTFRAKPGEESAGNNLSFPVIWAEGYSILPAATGGITGANGFTVQNQSLPGVGTQAVVVNPGVTNLTGEWWYWWGVIQGSENEPDIPLVCFPNPADESSCIDGSDPDPGWVKAYVQKDPNNTWQATSIDAGGDPPVEVDWIDWGDNLESVDWNTRSKVRTEVVLYKNNPGEDWTEYEMRHVSGWGINEVHGLAVDQDGTVLEGPGTQATVYTHCARMRIQKIIDPEEIAWSEVLREWTGEIKDPIFDGAVYEAGDGPGFYSAEVNVKGRVIYGYTWDVRKLQDPDEPTGLYRITFMLDDNCGTFSARNATLVNAQIQLPEEEVEASEDDDGGDTGGGVAEIIQDQELTYIDVRIEDGKGKTGGGNGNSGGKGGGNPGGGKGKGG